MLNFLKILEYFLILLQNLNYIKYFLLYLIFTPLLRFQHNKNNKYNNNLEIQIKIVTKILFNNKTSEEITIIIFSLEQILKEIMMDQKMLNHYNNLLFIIQRKEKVKLI